MKFAHAEILWLLCLIPAFIGLEYWHYRHGTQLRNSFSEKIFLKHWIPQRSVYWKQFKVLLLALAMIFFILALARPQGKPVHKEMLRKQNVIYFILDCSASMRARDAYPDRFQAAKSIIEKSVQSLPGKKVGLIIFNQQASVMCPVTYDYQSFMVMLKQMQIDILPQPGSNPAAGLQLALEKLRQVESDAKAIVLLSDGEENSNESLMSYAHTAKEKGIKIFCIGLGTLKGSLIPDGKDFWGKPQFKKHHGKIVKTRLQAAAMRKISKLSGGYYLHWTQETSELKKITMALRKMSSTRKGKEEILVYQEYFPWFVGIAFLILLIEPLFSLIGRQRYD